MQGRTPAMLNHSGQGEETQTILFNENKCTGQRVVSHQGNKLKQIKSD